jgi:hypothetical protein
MNNASTKFFALAVALFAAAFLLQPASANACMRCPGFPFCIPLPPTLPTASEIYVTFPSPGQAQLAVYGYETTSLQPGGECVTAVAPLQEIDSVTSVVNYNSLTNQPFTEVDFNPSDVPSRTVTRMAADIGLVFPNGVTWPSFLSSITGTVPDGVPNHFVIDVQLSPGVTPLQFLAALKEQGVFITGSSHSGIPHGGDHLHTKRFADFDIIALLPGSFSDAALDEEVKE